MTSPDKYQVDQLFRAALDLPVDERKNFLVTSCGGNDALYEEICRLLVVAEETDTRVDEELLSARDTMLGEVFELDGAVTEDLSGQVAGHWRLVRKIARGGLATVYLAERCDGEYEQEAAVKILRRGLDSEDLISRFRIERQILSNLDHPSIANIIDGGALNDGRPYLVAEFIDGVAIDQHCVSESVGTHEKVRLMIKVLGALHHAHKHLVVHRDLKPANILTTKSGAVSLIDFGIAKILDPASMPESTTSTRIGVSVLTPGYASPEQVEGASITTASDIYQCGLVLFELLTGQRSNRRQPIPPSRLLSGKPEYKQVSGDLDAIVAKATHLDPAQRYASANEMLADLERYLDGRPILARPDSLVYRAGKLFRRKPWILPVSTIVALGLIAYVTTINLYSTQLAEKEAIASASQQFLVGLFRSPDPYSHESGTFGTDVTVIQAMELGRNRIDKEFANQPAVRQSLLASIAEVYGSLDRQEEAIQIHSQALVLAQSTYGETSPQALDSMRALVTLYRATGDDELASANAQAVLSLTRKSYSESSAELGLAEITVGMDQYFAGDVTGGRTFLEHGIERLRPFANERPNELINALIVYAMNLGFDDTEADRAFAAIQEAAEIALHNFGNGSLQHTLVQIRLASSLTLVDEYVRSAQLFEQALPQLASYLGENHSTTMTALANFAFMTMMSGQESKAEVLYSELLERQVDLFGPRSRQVADANQNLGALYSGQELHRSAIPHLQLAHEIYSDILGRQHYVTGFPLLTMSYSYIQMGDFRAAESTARNAMSDFDASVPGSYLYGVAQCLVGVSIERQGAIDTGTEMVNASHALIGDHNVSANYLALCRFPENAPN